MSFGIHALNIGVVVLPLRAVIVVSCRIGARRTAKQQANASAHRSAILPPIAAPAKAPITVPMAASRNTVFCYATDLLKGILTALRVVKTKIIKLLSVPGKAMILVPSEHRHSRQAKPTKITATLKVFISLLSQSVSLRRRGQATSLRQPLGHSFT